MYYNIGNIVKKGKLIMIRLFYDFDDVELLLFRVRGNCLKSIIKLGDNVSWSLYFSIWLNKILNMWLFSLGRDFG